jgi:hypothetical protein
VRRLFCVFGVVVVFVSACGDDDDEATTSGADTTSVETTAVTPGTSGTDAPRTEVTTGGTAAGGAATATTTKVGQTAVTAAAPSTTSASATPATADVTAPGRYVYSVRGKQSSPAFGEQPVPPEGTLTVDPPNGRDQRQVNQGGNATTEQILRFTDNGVLIVYLKITGPGFVLEFRPSPPVLATPRPVAPGRTWSWSMQSTDGTTTVKSDFRAVRVEKVTIGTEAVDTIVIDANVVTTGTINSTGRRTFWGSDRYKLVVQDSQVTDGTVGAVQFHAESNAKLRSTKPS